MSYHTASLVGVRTSKVRESFSANSIDTDATATSSSLGLSYDISPELTVYASAGRSFEANSGQSFGGDYFAPRRGKQFEIGAKGNSIDKKIAWTAAAYRLIQDNVTTADPVNPGFSAPLGEVEVQGVEFDVSAELTPRLSFLAALTFADAEITKNNSGLQGNRPGNTPKFSGAARLSYRFDHGWRLGGTVVHVGRRDGSDTALFELPAYSRLDLDASWQATPRWTLRANLENATDKNYVSGSFLPTFITLGRPRTLSLSAKYLF